MACTNHVTLNIDENTPPRPHPLYETLHRMDNMMSNGASLEFRNHLSNVLREMRPFVEQAHTRMNQDSRMWRLNTPNTHQVGESSSERPQNSAAQVNIGPNGHTFVQDRVAPPTQRQQSAYPVLTNSDSIDSNPPEHEQEQTDINISVNPTNNNNINENEDNDSLSEDGPHQILDVRAFVYTLSRFAPFVILLLLKFLYDSREGIFTFILLLCTFLHSNSLVKKEFGKQMDRSVPILLLELCITTTCVTIVHFILGHDKLLPNVVMFPGYTEPIDISELLWLVILTDLIVKIITVNVKTIITMMPVSVLPFQKRGKIYMFTESVSQLYRSLLTVQPWIFFLMQSYKDSEKMVGMFLTTVFVISKIFEVYCKLSSFKKATWGLLESVNLGTKPTAEQLLAAGESCPICHEEYTTPVRLACSHIFCELCISVWLDREFSCPLCRAKVGPQPQWRDGSTTYEFQLC